jgi:hypothetical protein
MLGGRFIIDGWSVHTCLRASGCLDGLTFTLTSMQTQIVNKFINTGDCATLLRYSLPIFSNRLEARMRSVQPFRLLLKMNEWRILAEWREHFDSRLQP